MDLNKISQFEEESINDYVVIWRAIVIDLTHALPQEELIKMFGKICNKHISSILQMQKHKMFKEALSQEKLI